MKEWIRYDARAVRLISNNLIIFNVGWCCCSEDRGGGFDYNWENVFFLYITRTTVNKNIMMLIKFTWSLQWLKDAWTDHNNSLLYTLDG